jgi:hypothetical protein
VLTDWAEQIAARRGKMIAVVALARRMAGILYAMMRDGKPLSLAKTRSGSPRPKKARSAGADHCLLRLKRAMQQRREAAGKMTGSRRPGPSVSADRARSP